MKLNDIEIGKEYATSKDSLARRLRIKDIRKVEVPTRFGPGTKKSSRRKVVADRLSSDGGRVVKEDDVYEAQQVKCLWEEYEERRRKQKEREIKAKQEQQAAYEKALEQNEDVLEALAVLEGFETRESYKGIQEVSSKGVKTKISHKGSAKVTLNYDRFLELVDKLSD